MAQTSNVCRNIPAVLTRLGWMRERRIWPNGRRYLWTDAFGVVLLVSLYRALGEDRYLEEAEWLVAEVDRVLGRRVDAFHGLVVYRLLDPDALAGEIAQMQELVEQSYRSLRITQDLGLGMMLWLSHFFPRQPWAIVQRDRALEILEAMWVDPPGYFCCEPGLPRVKFAFTNYGISLGLQSVAAQTERVNRLNAFFADYRSGDGYDTDAITHVMGCTSHLPGDFIPGGIDGAA